ncbi:ATP-binding cassette domain-containing protein [Chitinophaga sp. G-6-1-13]|uniref:ATP-binding cassette domain-containing protein n=1 Tax=Chitinophaga fulva TaxID=2728842 RepID=A0A848GN70_9BACT|nr:ATP-binding cassette domain-containing protein [Chitinophaga fulva]NML39906.1 ATP-binding cassette domain-containing protein [Chitinophaga fulva]
MRKSPVDIDKQNTVIHIRGLYKSFDTVAVLTGMDLDLYKGENVVVLGRSGSGKSVLIKLIAGLLKPDSGTICVAGEEIDQLSPRALQELRLKIGFLYQGSALYDSMTVRENLEFPLVRNSPHLTHEEREDTIREVLENVGLSQSIDKMPSELSGGQKKRVGIARTLILHPDIMLYDEPTAGLDPVTSSDINMLINEVQQKYRTSSVIITHDLTCAKTTGDRIALITDGKFSREGTFEEVFQTGDAEAKKFYDYNFIIDT